MVQQIKESLDIVQLRKDIMKIGKERDEVKAENALMGREHEKHSVIIPSYVEELEEDEQLMEVESLGEGPTGCS